MDTRLRILNIAPMPASPPRFGAQARMHGLLSALARQHEVTAVVQIDPMFDLAESYAAMASYCRDVIFVVNPRHPQGWRRRLRQVRSLASRASFERLQTSLETMQWTLSKTLTAKRFDLVLVEFGFFGHYHVRQAPCGETPPVVIVDAHNLEYDLARQYAQSNRRLQRLYAEVNWRKLKTEELAAYRAADGVALTSPVDEQRLLAEVPGLKTIVVPNAADVDYYQPRPSDPPPDGRTIVFFGHLSYLPNAEAVIHFAMHIWPRIAMAHPEARWQIIGGGQPSPAMLALSDRLGSDRVEIIGLVPDLRPWLAAAALVVVPLRYGGGTRLKIVEAMAMGKAVVSTARGAEGIEAMPGRDLVIADSPLDFADAVCRLLAEPGRAARIGRSARELAVSRYAWNGAATALEAFFVRHSTTSPF